MDEIERTLLVKPEVFMYKIGPRPSARGFRAADWNLANPDWTGRLRLQVRGRVCEIRLEDKNTGELFGACPVEHYPGSSVEPVTDSSRYFVICLQDSGRKAYIGIGFADRSDSFDLNVALQDHFKWLKKDAAIEQEANDPDFKKPDLDLAFKEGQTIRINIPKKEAAGSATSRPKATSGSGFLPPPPGANASGGGGVPRVLPLPPAAANLTPMQSPQTSNVDLLGDLNADFVTKSETKSSNEDPWGEFASAGDSNNAAGNWVQF